MLPRPLLLLPLALLLGAFILSACGGDDDDLPEVSPPAGSGESTASLTVPGPTGGADRDDREPTIEAPINALAPLIDDIGEGYWVDLAQTRAITPEDYAATIIFTSPETGAGLLTEWGYAAGFRTVFEPQDRTDAVLESGKYYTNIEVHRFDASGGAHEFLEHFETRLGSGNATPLDDAPVVGNESSAWQGFDSAPVPNSDIPAVFHWYLFRRGNIVAVIRTWGAEPFMSSQQAYAIATIIDEKALGDRPAPEPTPIPTADAGQPAETPAQ